MASRSQYPRGTGTVEGDRSDLGPSCLCERGRLSTVGPITEAGLISVIVPVRDDPEGIRELLHCLSRQTLPEDRFEIVIGDDGSRPGSLSGIDLEGGRVRVATGPPRTSYAARNMAARLSRGSILAFCDADCRPDPSWLEMGLEALSSADVIAGEVTFDPPPRPTVWSLLTMDMFLDQERNVRLSTACTANLLVRRSAFEEVGGFDESLPSGGDYDFTRRAVAHGARLIHAPSAIVRHPTIDRWRPFLRKVWFTNRWSAVQKARSGLRPEWISLFTFVPFIGVALARRHALRPIARLCRSRLVAAGLNPGWREDLRAIPLLYCVVAYVAGFGRTKGWLESRSAPALSTLDVSSGAPAPATAIPRAAPRPWLGLRRKSGRTDALPNLVVVGAQKCGTSALHFYLGLHPEVFMSRTKELDFFIENRNWDRGVDWYRRQFSSAVPVRGESSPNYSAFPKFKGVPERMASVTPDVRIVYLVRDPLERIASHWVHNYARRRERGDLRTTLLHPSELYVARSRYHFQLQRFGEHFDRDRILVLESRDLRDRRLHTLRRVFEFVGVDPEFSHPKFERVLHRTAVLRRVSKRGLHILNLSETRLGRAVPQGAWNALRRSLFLSSPIGAAPDVRPALGEEVLEVLREDADQLRRFMRCDLVHWSL